MYGICNVPAPSHMTVSVFSYVILKTSIFIRSALESSEQKHTAHPCFELVSHRSESCVNTRVGGL